MILVYYMLVVQFDNVVHEQSFSLYTDPAQHGNYLIRCSIMHDIDVVVEEREKTLATRMMKLVAWTSFFLGIV